MESLGGNSGAGMVGRGSSTVRWTGSFGVQGSSKAQNLGTTNLFRQVEQLIVAAKEEKTT